MIGKIHITIGYFKNLKFTSRLIWLFIMLSFDQWFFSNFLMLHHWLTSQKGFALNGYKFVQFNVYIMKWLVNVTKLKLESKCGEKTRICFLKSGNIVMNSFNFIFFSHCGKFLHQINSLEVFKIKSFHEDFIQSFNMWICFVWILFKIRLMRRWKSKLWIILPNFDMKFIYASNLTKQNGLIMFNTNNLLLVNM